MLAKTFSAAVIGIDAYPVEIEVNAAASEKSAGNDNAVSIVGLPDMAVRESRDRVRSAIQSSCFLPPKGFTVVNLAPADLRKEGGAFDLGIALGMLAATGTVPPETLAKYAVIGELALDGSIRPVKGALPIADCLARRNQLAGLIVPVTNAEEAALAAGGRMPVYAAASLRDAVSILLDGNALPCHADLREYTGRHAAGREPDFDEVKGQMMARRAMEIAAAGGHNLLMNGSPGTGKSMISMRLPGILPPMTIEETLETSRIHSVLGLLSDGQPLLNRRPFRAPHHTISDVGLIGGGRDPKPGEISLAHNGVLFLDELPEFKRNVLEVLRQPLENGLITVSRAAGSCTFPARFILCAAMNPCPCGRGDYELGCTCKLEEKRRYQKRISGPLLDRIDLLVPVRQLSQDELMAAPDGESSEVIRERVIKARAIQRERLGKFALYCNSQMSSRDLQNFCRLAPSSALLLRTAITKFKLSPRAYDRILKVARTIADLAGSAAIRDEHIFEAINYRKSGFPAE
ncbi:MAG: YifB family Mg chelatase-like AAA ATPase [Lentisphaeria bacterium]|nr:YifB family Mg chelatase-like AAA ATPase [Lentisphaeria bacterium]